MKNKKIVFVNKRDGLFRSDFGTLGTLLDANSFAKLILILLVYVEESLKKEMKILTMV